MNQSGQITRHVFIVSALALWTGTTASGAGEPDPANTRIAEQFARKIADGKLEAAVEHFDEKMKGLLPPEKLKDVLAGIEMQFGPLKSLGSAEALHVGNLDIVLIPATYERGALRYKISLDREHRVSGFYIEPAAVQAGYKPPAYDTPADYTEQDVKFGQKPWTISGRLTLPRTRALAPIVVLVHGSGPHDEDETIGPNKPFRDLAVGLAGRGVATLRYQKRTYAHRDRLAKVSTITLQDEVIDDALAALKFAAGCKGIDRSKVYLLGHSLGGTLAPIIASKHEPLAGVILMAGSARDPFEVIRDQLDYIATIRGPQQEANKKLAVEIHRAIKRANAGREKPGEMLLGAPIGYWRELREATGEALKILPELKTRVLVLGGGRDYQVIKADYNLFKERLADNRRASFKWFESANHLFMSGKGRATPDEYARANNVDRRVIDHLAEWIRSPGPAKP